MAQCGGRLLTLYSVSVLCISSHAPCVARQSEAKLRCRFELTAVMSLSPHLAYSWLQILHYSGNHFPLLSELPRVAMLIKHRGEQSDMATPPRRLPSSSRLLSAPRYRFCQLRHAVLMFCFACGKYFLRKYWKWSPEKKKLRLGRRNIQGDLHKHMFASSVVWFLPACYFFAVSNPDACHDSCQSKRWDTNATACLSNGLRTRSRGLGSEKLLPEETRSGRGISFHAAGFPSRDT